MDVDTNDTRVSRRLLHYRVNEDFDKDGFVFASEYVQEEVTKRLYTHNRKKYLDFIAASDGLGPLAVHRGCLVEGYAHSVLSKGGTFRICRLQDGNDVSTRQSGERTYQ